VHARSTAIAGAVTTRGLRLHATRPNRTCPLGPRLRRRDFLLNVDPGSSRAKGE
jgi:hypothetical protein